MDWYDDGDALNIPLNNRECKTKAWSITDQFETRTHRERSDVQGRLSRLDYFLLMFPPKQLAKMVHLTSDKLVSDGKTACSTGEMLKFFGVMILVTKYEFTCRRSLWSTVAPFKYMAAPAFGRTGMSRNRFDEMFQWVTWSEQPKIRPDATSHEKFRWMLVDGFVNEINAHRAKHFDPSDLICIDESISRWYGMGGHWINLGLPMYIAMDRKPENGCEIQNACCARSGIMMRLKLVKTAKEESTNEIAEDEIGLLHGTRILLFLVSPWNYSFRTVVGDSYFASVGAAEQLELVKLGFIGVVKTSSRRFPMKYLSNIEFNDRGETQGVVAKNVNGRATMMAFVWMDRQRRYFIATSSSLQQGLPYLRRRWRQVDETINADAELVQLSVPQPKAAEVYYSGCGKIDQHNRHRQDTLKMETKLKTHDWAKRVNISLFGMMVVDCWLAFNGCTAAEETQKEFYMLLAEELIDNTYDNSNVARRERRVHQTHSSPTLAAATGAPRAGVAAHLTPTKRKRKAKDGSTTKYLMQGRCMVCSLKTTYHCSQCVDDKAANLRNCPSRDPWICGTKNGKLCYATHMSKKHLV